MFREMHTGMPLFSPWQATHSFYLTSKRVRCYAITHNIYTCGTWEGGVSSGAQKIVPETVVLGYGSPSKHATFSP